MEITLFYTKTQRDKLWEAGLKPEMVYFLRGQPIVDEDWKKVNKNKLQPFSGLLDILREIEKTKKIIDPVVDEYVNHISHSQIREIVKYITTSPSWRERPLIMKLTSEMLIGEFTNSVIHAAAGVELFEESAILLDDVLDEAELCVGKETVWRKYGIKETFLAHGILASLARKAIIESFRLTNLDSIKSKEIITSFETIYYNDYKGQFMDIFSEKHMDFSEEDYWEMISRTPGTQFANALEIVSILVRKEEFREELKEFGNLFGIAAQLRDDIIDIIGEEEVVYKKLLTDIERKKKRLPLVIFLKRHPEFKEAFLLNKYLEKEKAYKISSIMKKEGIIEECIHKCQEVVKKSITRLMKLPDNKGRKKLFCLIESLANFIG